MAETEQEKRQRILTSERDHGAEPHFAARVTRFDLAEPVDAPFHTLLAYRTKWYSPRGTTPTSVVMHCTGAENPASSTANYFASSTESGSTQAVCDDVEGFTCVPDDAVCAGAPPLNQEGLHIELSGSTARTREQWLAHDAQLRRAARHVADWCRKYDIPPVLLHAADLLALGEKARGITYHAAVSRAFHQSTHTDLDPNFPYDVFVSYVREALAPPKPKVRLGVVVRKSNGTFTTRLSIWRAARVVARDLRANADKVKAGDGPAVVIASLRLYEDGDGN